MADFIFRVDSVQLTDAQQEKIATAIQGAVLTELARLDLHGDQARTKSSATATGGSSGGGSFLYRPVNWKGGIMIPPGEVATVANSSLAVMDRAGSQSKVA
jgi:hypothetical protein